MEKLYELVEQRGLSIALVGTGERVIEIVAKNLIENHPKLNFLGFSHGYLTNDEDNRLREQLKEWQSRILVIGMGQPRQERWATAMREHLPNTVFLCVGGLFDYYAGLKPTPPAIIRKIGFEWLYLLFLRPADFGNAMCLDCRCWQVTLALRVYEI